MDFYEESEGFPLIGETIPELDVQTTHGMMNLPKDIKGKWAVLFSHPGDFTPVCTTEFVAFSKRQKEFKKLNTELIGLSIDQVQSHIKWVQWIEENLDEKITFPVIADGLGEVSSALGMIHPGKGTNTVRAVFILDTNGVIRTIMYYPQEIGRNIDEILRTVEALQVSDRTKRAMPENWPNNELFGSDVIVPPASDEKTAKARMKKKGCIDWWLCHEKMPKKK